MIMKDVVLDEFDRRFESNWRQVLTDLGFRELAKNLPQGGGSFVFPISLFIPGEKDQTYTFRGETSYWCALLEAKNKIKHYRKRLTEEAYEQYYGDEARKNEDGRDPVSYQAHVTTQRYIHMLARRNQPSPGATANQDRPINPDAFSHDPI